MKYLRGISKHQTRYTYYKVVLEKLHHIGSFLKMIEKK